MYKSYDELIKSSSLLSMSKNLLVKHINKYQRPLKSTTTMRLTSVHFMVLQVCM